MTTQLLMYLAIKQPCIQNNLISMEKFQLKIIYYYPQLFLGTILWHKHNSIHNGPFLNQRTFFT
jgi:hypothetical protein